MKVDMVVVGAGLSGLVATRRFHLTWGTFEMGAQAGNELIDRPQLQATITARDAQLAHSFGKDAQLAAINSAANIEVTG